VLDIAVARPQRAISDEVATDVFVRRDPKSSEVVGLMILNFSKRFGEKKATSVPVAGHFALVR
jgi:hypothetical protein